MRVLVTGAGGQLGRDVVDVFSGVTPSGGSSALVALAPGRGWEVTAADHTRLDVADRSQVGAVFEAVRPHLVVHAAAWTAVDACEGDPARAFAVNAMGTRHIAEAARRHATHVLYVSTDYVFDGTSPRPYVEWDRPNPLSVYGRSKWGGEQELGPDATVVRTSWVCGFHGANMVRTVRRLAAATGTLRFVDDQRGSPTFTADLAAALAFLGAERLPGTFHLTNSGETTWFDFARGVLRASGHDDARVEPIATADLDPPRPAPRPANSVLENRAWESLGLSPMPSWTDGLQRLVGAFDAAGIVS